MDSEEIGIRGGTIVRGSDADDEHASTMSESVLRQYECSIESSAFDIFATRSMYPCSADSADMISSLGNTKMCESSATSNNAQSLGGEL